MPQLPHCHSQKRPGVPAVPGIDATCMWRTLPQTVEFNWDTDGINFVVLTLTVPLMMHQGFLVLSSLAAAQGCGGTVMAASHGTICTDTSRSDPAFPSTCGFSPGCGWFIPTEHFHSCVDSFSFLQSLGAMSYEECLRTLGLSSLEAEG